jgi:hypothetical protein
LALEAFLIFKAVLKVIVDFKAYVDWSGNQQPSLTEAFLKIENIVIPFFPNASYR